MSIVRERIEKSNRFLVMEDAASEIGVTVFEDGHVGVILTHEDRLMHIALCASSARAIAARLKEAAEAVESHGGSARSVDNVH